MTIDELKEQLQEDIIAIMCPEDRFDHELVDTLCHYVVLRINQYKENEGLIPPQNQSA